MKPSKSLAELNELAAVLESANPQQFESLLDFARFLHAKLPAEALSPQTPLEIPRPDEESVVAAIKRLSKTYPMLDKKIIFEQTSAAMSAHILEEVPAKDAIDRLERVFADAYQRYESENQVR